MTPQNQNQAAQLQIKNIGGIDQKNITVPPGVTILVGENATNRSSVIQALKGILGSTALTLKTGSESGSVEMEFKGTHTRTVTRTNETVSYAGDAYLNEESNIRKAELFACLDATNDIRQSIRTGGDGLRDLLVEPVDMADIEAEIRELQSERQELKRDLNQANDAQNRLTQLISKRQQLQTKLEETESELEDLRDDVERHNKDIKSVRQDQQEIDKTLNELDDLRSRLDTTEKKLETSLRSHDKSIEERDQIQAELEEIEVRDDRINELDQEIRQLKEKRNKIDQTVSSIENIIQFNSQFVTGSLPDAVRFIGSTTSEDGTTDSTERVTQQLSGDHVRCWTCGSSVPMIQVEDTLDELRNIVSEKRADLSSLASELDNLKEEYDSLVEEQKQSKNLEQKLSDIKEEIETRKKKVTRLEHQKEELEDDIAELSTRLQDIELEEAEEEFLELYQQINEYEREYGRLESQLEQVDEEIEECKAQSDSIDEIKEDIEKINDSIKEKRNKIDRLETTAINEFNNRMDTIIEELDYENIARIWLEKNKSNQETSFELNVVREIDGTMHQDTIDHLSESEREVTGLVVALAGYIAYDLADTVPIVVLDSVESLDATRLATFIQYISEFVGYILVSVLPEDAESMPDSFNRIYFNSANGEDLPESQING